jgi:hypothetical protein
MIQLNAAARLRATEITAANKMQVQKLIQSLGLKETQVGGAGAKWLIEAPENEVKKVLKALSQAKIAYSANYAQHGGARIRPGEDAPRGHQYDVDVNDKSSVHHY